MERVFDLNANRLTTILFFISHLGVGLSKKIYTTITGWHVKTLNSSGLAKESYVRVQYSRLQCEHQLFSLS